MTGSAGLAAQARPAPNSALQFLGILEKPGLRAGTTDALIDSLRAFDG